MSEHFQKEEIDKHYGELIKKSRVLALYMASITKQEIEKYKNADFYNLNMIS